MTLPLANLSPKALMSLVILSKKEVCGPVVSETSIIYSQIEKVVWLTGTLR
jgi:hypothetical protein